MSKRRLLWWIPLLLIALLIVPVGRSLWYYRGLPLPRAVATPDLSGLTVAPPAPGEFVDRPQAGRGLALVDQAHGNVFSPAELSVLTAYLSARGLTVRDLTSDDDLATALRPATALVVAVPGGYYTAKEVAAVRHFVERGGRLLLIADPTRYVATYDEETGESLVIDSALFINPLAAPFGLSFEDDYLYNVVKHEGNYQNILLTQFEGVSLTAGLSQVAFYATHSIHARAGGTILADGDTRSSTNELGRNLPVAALDSRGQVLALGDLTFMTSPYSSVLDNGRLIANIADFLAGAERRYELADFPYYFGDEVALVTLGSPQLTTAQVAASSELQRVFQEAGKGTVAREKEDPALDTFFLGLYDRAEDIADQLKAVGITVQVREGEDEEAVTYTLDISGTGQVDGTGLALLSLQQKGERQVLIVLADKDENLKTALQSLASGNLAGCLTLRDTLALCTVGEGGAGWGEGEEGAGEEGGGGAPGGEEAGAILIVAEDDLYEQSDCFTGLFAYDLALYESYSLTLWSESDQGSPSLAELQKYAAVVWTAGDCAGKAPDEQDAEMLRQYVGAGGRLLIEGMSIGADWNGTDFYGEVCHAQSDHAATQLDLQVADASHPVAKGFEAGQTIEFLELAADYEPDVITALPEAKVIFARGPKSEDSGQPSIIAYESSGTRVVYVAFPIYILPEEDMNTIIQDAVRWLVEK